MNYSEFIDNIRRVVPAESKVELLLSEFQYGYVLMVYVPSDKSVLRFNIPYGHGKYELEYVHQVQKAFAVHYSPLMKAMR